MALTPMDIITKHLNIEQEKVESAAGHMDVAALAIAINEELKQNFRVYSRGATDAIEVEHIRKDYLSAASVPLWAAPQLLPEGTTELTFRADNNPMLWYIGTDQKPYRLDEMTPGDSFPLRERQIALALTDLSANALKDQTL